MAGPCLASKLWRPLTLKATSLPAADIVSPRPPTSIEAGQWARDIEPSMISSVISRSVTRSWTALGLVLALLLMSSAVAGEEKTGDVDEKARASITVEGNKRVDVATVRSYFHASPDGRFDEAARDAGLKALIGTHLFDKVSIERSGEKLIVHLHEAPVIDRVAFEGNKRVKDGDLSPVVESKARGSLQRTTVQSDVEHIVDAYRHLGRDDVTVKPVVIDRGNDRVDLVFE